MEAANGLSNWNFGQGRRGLGRGRGRRGLIGLERLLWRMPTINRRAECSPGQLASLQSQQQQHEQQQQQQQLVAAATTKSANLLNNFCYFNHRRRL